MPYNVNDFPTPAPLVPSTETVDDYAAKNRGANAKVTPEEREASLKPRYSTGEEPRVGDTVRLVKNGEEAVISEGSLSRAGASWEAEAAHNAASCDPRAVIGTDCHGKEVRVGDTVRDRAAPSSIGIVVASLEKGIFYSPMKVLSVSSLYAELVTEDERPVLGKDCDGTDVRRGDRLAHVGENCSYFEFIASEFDELSHTFYAVPDVKGTKHGAGMKYCQLVPPRESLQEYLDRIEPVAVTKVSEKDGVRTTEYANGTAHAVRYAPTTDATEPKRPRFPTQVLAPLEWLTGSPLDGHAFELGLVSRMKGATDEEYRDALAQSLKPAASEKGPKPTLAAFTARVTTKVREIEKRRGMTREIGLLFDNATIGMARSPGFTAEMTAGEVGEVIEWSADMAFDHKRTDLEKLDEHLERRVEEMLLELGARVMGKR